VKNLPKQFETYLRFVRLTGQLKDQSKIPGLDAIEQELLNVIALHLIEGRSLLVSDVIYLKQIGSAATLQRRLFKLIKGDFIRIANDVDGRKKYLELSPKSIAYIAKMGECVAAATSKT
jgi:hypothetical protein